MQTQKKEVTVNKNLVEHTFPRGRVFESRSLEKLKNSKSIKK